MDELKKHKIMELANCEQTISTGADDEGSEVRGPKLAQHVIDTLRTIKNPGLKKRLLGVYIAAQRGVVDDALMDAAGVNASDNFHRKLQRMLRPVAPSPMAAAAKAGGGGLMSVLGFGRGDKPSGAASATAEGDYQDTRHVGVLKGLLEQMITGELDKDKYPAVGPSISSSAQAQENAKSQRKTNTKNERWARKGKSVSGSRCMCFVLGGLTYSEMRAGYELQATHSKEVVVGGTSFLSPDEYMADVKSLSS
jgi:syntaxin-binding protein 1